MAPIHARVMASQLLDYAHLHFPNEPLSEALPNSLAAMRSLHIGIFKPGGINTEPPPTVDMSPAAHAKISQLLQEGVSEQQITALLAKNGYSPEQIKTLLSHGGQ